MHGITITNIVIAFLGGLFSFLSPCVLPLVPGYVSLISGVSIDRLKNDGGGGSLRAVMMNSVAFNAGLSVIFLALGATAGWAGHLLTNNIWVRVIGGVVIIAFGLQLIGLLKITALYKDTRFFSQQKPRGILGSFTLGMAFAAGWTPCIGPIMGGIIGMAAFSGGWKAGLFLSSFYAAGLAVPFLLTGLGINRFLGFYAKFRKHLHKVEVASGIMLIAIGFLMMTNNATWLASSRFMAWLPNPENGLKLETTPSGSIPAQTSFEAAPDLEFQTLEGQPLRLKDLRGRVVVLNYWATWCLPCKDEIPSFNAIQREMQPRGLEIVGANWSDTAEGVKSYQQSVQRLDYKVVLGGERVEPLPTTLIIDREGRVRERIVGTRSQAEFEAIVKPLLDEAPATARN